jgi:hypothetical protein
MSPSAPCHCPLSPLVIDVIILVIVVPLSTSMFITLLSLLSLLGIVVSTALEGCDDGGAGAGALSPPSAFVIAIVVSTSPTASVVVVQLSL